MITAVPLQLASLTSIEFAALADDSRPFVVLLPLGSVEPHGPHLSLLTDEAISVAVAARAALRLESLGQVIARIGPSIPYGVTECAAAFPGAVSVAADALTMYVHAVVEGYLRARVDHVCLINNHLEPEHDRAVRLAAEGFEPGRVSVACPLTRRWARTLSAEFKSGACHAGRYETAIVMAHDSTMVRDEIRQKLPAVPISLAEKLQDGISDFRAMGLDNAYAGDPSLASPDEGNDLIGRLVDMVVGEVTEGMGTSPESS